MPNRGMCTAQSMDKKTEKRRKRGIVLPPPFPPAISIEYVMAQKKRRGEGRREYCILSLSHGEGGGGSLTETTLGREERLSTMAEEGKEKAKGGKFH